MTRFGGVWCSRAAKNKSEIIFSLVVDTLVDTLCSIYCQMFPVNLVYFISERVNETCKIKSKLC